jgi:hypothetical protein
MVALVVVGKANKVGPKGKTLSILLFLGYFEGPFKAFQSPIMISSAELHKFAFDCARVSLGDAAALINYRFLRLQWIPGLHVLASARMSFLLACLLAGLLLAPC